MPARVRCPWAGTDHSDYVRYHDEEWGVPVHDDRLLFEFLILEGAQAGLSWSTILRKRDNYRQAFAGFDAATRGALRRARRDAAARRSRDRPQPPEGRAPRSTTPAPRWRSASEHGSLDRYLWRFVDGRPVQNRWSAIRQVPAETDASRALSKALRADGFRFVGPTICYAFMQATGMVNDHLVACFRHRQVARRR